MSDLLQVKYLPRKLSSIREIIEEFNKVKKLFIPRSDLKDTFLRIFGEESLCSTDYEIARNVIPAYFTVDDPELTQSRIQSCIAGLNRTWNKLLKNASDLINQQTTYQFHVVLGAFQEFHSIVNIWSKSINLESRDSTQLIKLCSGIDTYLSFLYSIEVNTDNEEKEEEKDPEETFWSVFENLTDQQKKLFIIENFNPRYTSDLDKAIANKVLENLLIYPDIQISEFDLAKLFDKSSQEKRSQFLRAISGTLTPKEIKVLKELLLDEN